MTSKIDGEPQFGYAIVRREEQKQSAGGIIVPDTADKADMVRYFVAASSDGYLDHGAMIPSTLKPGDEIVLAPNGTTKVLVKDQASGKPMERMLAIPRLLQSPLLPEDHYIVLLADVAYRVPAERVQSVVGESPRVKLVEGGRVH